jgi:hypothetical protein
MLAAEFILLNGEILRGAFVLDAHDREAIAWRAVAGQKRGLTPTMRREQKRRNSLEAVIGHAKFDHRMDRNHLLGAIGDAINALARLRL